MAGNAENIYITQTFTIEIMIKFSTHTHPLSHTIPLYIQVFAQSLRISNNFASQISRWFQHHLRAIPAN